jgi:hypothetical protein
MTKNARNLEYSQIDWKTTCKRCGNHMADKKSQELGRCYSCRKSIYVRNELIKVFGPLRVPELPTDENGNIIWT